MRLIDELKEENLAGKITCGIAYVGAGTSIVGIVGSGIGLATKNYDLVNSGMVAGTIGMPIMGLGIVGYAINHLVTEVKKNKLMEQQENNYGNGI